MIEYKQSSGWQQEKVARGNMEKTLYIPFIQSSRGSACLPSSRYLLFHLLSLLILYCILCIFLDIFSVFGIWRWLQKRFVLNFYGFVRFIFFPIYIIYIIDICNNLHRANKASTMRYNYLKMFDKYMLLCNLPELRMNETLLGIFLTDSPY